MTISHLIMNIRFTHIFLWLILLQGTLSVRPSPGCSSKSVLSKGKVKRKTIHFTYEDKLLGPVDRNYIIQIPKGKTFYPTFLNLFTPCIMSNWSETDNETPKMMVLDLHGWTGSAASKAKWSGWRQLGKRKDFIVVWPDGMRDGPNQWGSWNCSMTIGPLGPTCDTDRNAWGQKQECYYSCPLCHKKTSCDWTSCYDDIGFLDYVIKDVTDKWCIDLDHVHLSGISNGGMFAYFLASMATDALGIASINPVGASPLLGFGTPPKTKINFSIIDFHGTDDDIIPHDVKSDYSHGSGPHDTVISWDGYYYEQKKNVISNWSQQMECDEEEVYETPYDGQSKLRCFARNCSGKRAILRCLGKFGHDYPIAPKRIIGPKIAYEFMKNHPRS